MENRPIIEATSNKQQATSNKQQATSNKPLLSRLKRKVREFPFIYNLVYSPLRWFIYKRRWYAHKLFSEISPDGLNRTEQRDRKVIASITSYPARINIVPWVIVSLMNQTMKPDRIILWLGEDKFPAKTLPKIFDKLKACGVEVEFREDLGPHTKYFHAIKENPEDIIITFDDDILYSKNIIADLYSSYLKHPKCVSGMRTMLINFNEDGSMKTMNEWTGEVSGHAGDESFKYFAEGCGGVLYPPHSLHNEAFNIEAIKKLCPKADDIWLKIMEVMNGVKAVPASNKGSVQGWSILNTEKTALSNYNNAGGGNSIQLKAVLEAYNNWPENGKTLLEIMREDLNGVE